MPCSLSLMRHILSSWCHYYWSWFSCHEMSPYNQRWLHCDRQYLLKTRWLFFTRITHGISHLNKACTYLKHLYFTMYHESYVHILGNTSCTHQFSIYHWLVFIHNYESGIYLYIFLRNACNPTNSTYISMLFILCGLAYVRHQCTQDMI